MPRRLRHNQKGFGLAEMIATIAIMAFLMLSAYRLILNSLRMTAENKFRLGATLLLDQEMEKIRSYAYSDVGLTTGSPRGLTPPTQYVANNNGSYTIMTNIQYVLDPADGLLPPDDPIASDYKKVSMRVMWDGPYGPSDTVGHTIVVPNGLETGESKGILVIRVIDANGLPVGQANIHIVNNNIATTVDQTAVSDDNGYYYFPGDPDVTHGYEITVTKAGYSTDFSTSSSATIPVPSHPNPLIKLTEVTYDTYMIDYLADLEILVVSPPGLPSNWTIGQDTDGDEQVNPRIAICGGFMYAIWQDTESGAGYRAYMQKYDIGTNPPTRIWDDLDVSNSQEQILPDIKTNASCQAYLAWSHNSGGNKAIYLSVVNPDKTIPIDKETIAANSDDQLSPRLAIAQDAAATATIIWVDDRNDDAGFDIYFQQVDKNGNERSTPEIRINDDAMDNNKDQNDPDIAVDSSNNVFAVWNDQRNGNWDIYGMAFSSSTGAGLWANNLLMTSEDAASDQYDPALASADDGSVSYLYMAWTDKRNGNEDVYFQKFDSDGNPQWADDIRVHASSTSKQYSPSIAYDSHDDEIYIAWVDERNKNPDIYANKFNITDGSMIWANEVRVNIGTDSAQQSVPYLAVNPATGRPFAIWQDEANGNPDALATDFEYYSAENPIPNENLDIILNKYLNLTPRSIPKFYASSTTNINGIATLNDIEWGGYSISIPSPSYEIAMTSLNHPPVEVSAGTTTSLIIYVR